MREAFALIKLLTFFQQKNWHISDINVWNFNETLTNNVISFEQQGPGLWQYIAGILLQSFDIIRWEVTLLS